jgi:hypothetical protein
MATEVNQTDVNLETNPQSSDEGNSSEQHTDGTAVDTQNKGIETNVETSAQARIRELSESNDRLQRLLEASLSQGRGNTNTEQPVKASLNIDKSTLTPTEAVLVAEVERLGADLSVYRNVLGGQHDAINKSEVLSNSTLAPLYREHEADVERYRREKREQGVYVTQKEALANVLLDKGVSVGHKTPVTPVQKQVARVPATPVTQSGAQVQATQQQNVSLRDKLKDAKF